MRLSNTQILYTAPAWGNRPGCSGTVGQMLLTPYPNDDRCISKQYSGSTGACFTDVKAMKPNEQTRWLFNLAVHLIVRDEMDPQVVHRTLCEIREYRDGLAPDTPVPEHLKRKFKEELAGEN